MNKEHNQGMKTELDIDVFEDLENLKIQLSTEQCLQPDSSIDKQIIAAAHREANKSIGVKSYRTSILQKLSLPLYIASGFILTVFAYKSLWYAPVSVGVNDTEQATVIEIDQNQVEQVSVETAKIRQSRTLPEHVPPEPIPGRVVTLSTPQQSSQSEQITSESTLIEQGIYTGNEFIKAEFPEKQAWVRAIITHLRNGESKQAREELVRFKRTYPDYPIEEQIKSLNQ